MPELLLELFSEEIPARMQARAAEDLVRLVGEACAPLAPSGLRGFSGPRRIALSGSVAAGVAASRSSERGPRANAPEQALAGFLRKHGASREQLRQEGDFFVLERDAPGIEAASLIARELPGVLRRFPWPKSMRWGGTSLFTWVRPLRRILCLLDGEVVPFDLRDGADDGHGLASGNLTEGHRFHAPGALPVASARDWQWGLHARHVIVDATERRTRVETGIAQAAATRGLTVVPDAGLLDEVAGLVEWPMPLLGRIDPQFMDLPPEVMQVSMRVNQRYFALRDEYGAAPWFAFAANVAATDGGAAIVAGNERVLRARFADARHFWDLDRKQTLASRVPALDSVTFHAKLGSQGERVRRLVRLAEHIAPLVGADAGLAKRAALLAKADLTTGMVGEFPELQGVMGAYYADHTPEPFAVSQAIRQHYLPKGPDDHIPRTEVACAVALADKIDMLTAFFAIGEKPTGSGDPFALRRAALGIIRIIFENRLNLPLSEVFGFANAQLPDRLTADISELLNFLSDRMRVLLGNKFQHNVLAAVLAMGTTNHLMSFLSRAQALRDLLGAEDGRNLLAAYRRAANILRIEEKKDGPHDGPVGAAVLDLAEETDLFAAVTAAQLRVEALLAQEAFADAMSVLATLRAPLDAFFDKVTVNDPRPDIRRNRLRLLSRVRAAMHLVADFSKIEG